MKSVTLFLGSALLATLGLAPAFASDGDDLRRATEDECRVAAIPAHTRTTQRTIHEPPLRRQRQVPRYETVTEPVYETKLVPVREMRDVPIYETVEVPVYRTERLPVWGEKQVTAYRKVRKPVTIEIWNPFECENECLELWDTCEDVPDGTKSVRAIVGHEERRVQCGTRLERKQVGTRSEEVVVGHRSERVKVAERTRRVCVGTDTEWIVVRPARDRVITETHDVPCERVTVIPDGTTRAAPLAGTARILTASQYEELLAAAR